MRKCPACCCPSRCVAVWSSSSEAEVEQEHTVWDLQWDGVPVVLGSASSLSFIGTTGSIFRHPGTTGTCCPAAPHDASHASHHPPPLLLAHSWKRPADQQGPPAVIFTQFAEDTEIVGADRNLAAGWDCAGLTCVFVSKGRWEGTRTHRCDGRPLLKVSMERTRILAPC